MASFACYPMFYSLLGLSYKKCFDKYEVNFYWIESCLSLLRPRYAPLSRPTFKQIFQRLKEKFCLFLTYRQNLETRCIFYHVKLAASFIMKESYPAVYFHYILRLRIKKMIIEGLREINSVSEMRYSVTSSRIFLPHSFIGLVKSGIFGNERKLRETYLLTWNAENHWIRFHKFFSAYEGVFFKTRKPWP